MFIMVLQHELLYTVDGKLNDSYCKLYDSFTTEQFSIKQILQLNT